MVDEASSAADTHLSPALVVVEAVAVLGGASGSSPGPVLFGSEGLPSHDGSWVDRYQEEPPTASRGAGTCEALCLVVARFRGARRRYRLAHSKSEMATVAIPAPGDAMHEEGMDRPSTGSLGAMVLLAKRAVRRVRFRGHRFASSTEEGEGGIELAPQAVPPILITAPDNEELGRPIAKEVSFPAGQSSAISFASAVDDVGEEDVPITIQASHHTLGTSPGLVRLMVPVPTTGTRPKNTSGSSPKAMVAILSSQGSQPMLGAYSAAAVSEEWADDGMDVDPSMRDKRTTRRSQPPKSEAPPKPPPKPNVFDEDLETDLMLLG